MADGPATFLERAVLRTIDPPETIQIACNKFARQYAQWVMGAVTPTPLLTTNQQRMESILIQAWGPKFGTPDKAVTGIVNAFTAFWLGTPVPGGVVVAVLGGAALAANLSSRFANPRATLQQVAFNLSACMIEATATVQYLIPPGPPLLLIPLPSRPWS